MLNTPSSLDKNAPPFLTHLFHPLQLLAPLSLLVSFLPLKTSLACNSYPSIFSFSSFLFSSLCTFCTSFSSFYPFSLLVLFPLPLNHFSFLLVFFLNFLPLFLLPHFSFSSFCFSFFLKVAYFFLSATSNPSLLPILPFFFSFLSYISFLFLFLPFFSSLITFFLLCFFHSHLFTSSSSFTSSFTSSRISFLLIFLLFLHSLTLQNRPFSPLSPPFSSITPSPLPYLSPLLYLSSRLSPFLYILSSFMLFPPLFPPHLILFPPLGVLPSFFLTSCFLYILSSIYLCLVSCCSMSIPSVLPSIGIP
jgi:hypothetical protein